MVHKLPGSIFRFLHTTGIDWFSKSNDLPGSSRCRLPDQQTAGAAVGSDHPRMDSKRRRMGWGSDAGLFAWRLAGIKPGGEFRRLPGR